MKSKKDFKSNSKVLFWGTYDLGKPRVRLLIKGAKSIGFTTIECHKNIWSGVQDKTQIKGWYKKLCFLFSWIFSYPSLIRKFLKESDYDVVLIPYMGHLDVLILWLFAKLKKKPIIWDVFISLYDTIVNDRKIVSKKSLLAHCIYIWEWLASRTADFLFLDTQSHADYFTKLFKIQPEKVGYVFVGAETDKFYPQNIIINSNNHFQVLFYGQFIPLHGIEIIIQAAESLVEENIEFIIIGTGQESTKIDRLIKKRKLDNIKRIPWVQYSALVNYINCAHVCLGIFGTSEKAKRVIPNKVYQILACKKPVITANTPAMKELTDFIGFDYPLIFLVPPGDVKALVEKILLIKNQYKKIIADINRLDFSPIDSEVVGKQLKAIIQKVIK